VSDERDDFYIGYAHEAPRSLGERTRFVALCLLTAAAFAGLILTCSQYEYDHGIFEYGVERDFVGRVELTPFPILVVTRAGAEGERDPARPATTKEVARPVADAAVASNEFSRYLLVAPGKFGAHELFASRNGKSVRFRGSLAYREGRTLVEVVPGSIAELPASATHLDERIPLGTVTLVGEIVDSKCYLGVMNPGRAKPHRACAVRCLSGGIPPLFIARDNEGRAAQMLLVGSDGRALNREILDFVAEPVKITGALTRTGDLLILRAEPGSIERTQAESPRKRTNF